MGKRLPYFALAMLLCISSCVLMGGRVRAASPIIFDGSVTWAVGQRVASNNNDFDYTTFTEQLPAYRSAGPIRSDLCGIPWSATSQTQFDSLPAYVCVSSRDLISNGGYIYLGFAFAYVDDGVSLKNVNNLSNTISSIKTYWYNPGSIQNAISNGYQFTTDKGAYSAPNSYLSADFVQPSITNPAFRGMTPFDGTNFARTFYFFGNTQTLDDWGAGYICVADYGHTSSNWIRTKLVQVKVSVSTPHDLYDINSRICCWIDISNVFKGVFKSRYAEQEYYLNGDDTVLTDYAYFGNCVYLLPLYCYATSSSSYDEVEQYLANIYSALQNINGGISVPQSVLESYAAMGSEAREAAEEAVRAMSVAQPTFNESDYDVFSNIDSVAMQQFSGVLSFLSLRRILPILLAALALVTIGYLFFGKK